MLRAHASPSLARLDDGVTPLCVATSNNSVRVVKTLVQAKANVDAVDLRGETAFTIACANGHLELVQILVRAGCDRAYIDAKSTTDLTGLEVAEEVGHTNVVEWLTSVEEQTFAKLTFAGSGFDSPRPGGSINGNHAAKNTIRRVVRGSDRELYDAAAEGTMERIDAAIGDGANVDCAVGDDGSTPLFIAAKKAHSNTVRILLRAGADIDKPTVKNTWTPFIIACYYGYLTIVQSLVRAGCDRMYLDAKGRDGRQWAEHKSQAAVARWLDEVKAETFSGVGEFGGRTSPGMEGGEPEPEPPLPIARKAAWVNMEAKQTNPVNGKPSAWSGCYIVVRDDLPSGPSGAWTLSVYEEENQERDEPLLRGLVRECALRAPKKARDEHIHTFRLDGQCDDGERFKLVVDVVSHAGLVWGLRSIPT